MPRVVPGIYRVPRGTLVRGRRVKIGKRDGEGERRVKWSHGQYTNR